MITFAQALDVARRTVRWRLTGEGFEDAAAYCIVLDSDGADLPAVLVDKATGRVDQVNVIENLERLGTMTPVETLSAADDCSSMGYMRKPCGPRCWEATSTVCHCPCGGEYHGSQVPLPFDTAFHLPGKHNQKAHGRRGRTSVTDGYGSRDTDDSPERNASVVVDRVGGRTGLSREFFEDPDAYWSLDPPERYDGAPVSLPPDSFGNTPPPMTHAAGARLYETRAEARARFEETQSAWHGQVPPEYEAAAARYSNLGAWAWNDEIREKGSVEDPMANALAAATRGTVIREDTVVFRGIKPETGAPLPGFRPGDSFHDPAFQSTSAAYEVARNSEVVMRVRLPAGTRGADLSATSVFGDRESEVLLPPGATYRVDAVHPGGYPTKTYLDVTLTHQGKRS